MSDIPREEKKSVKNKLREFEKQGLLSYRNYLDERLIFASQSESRASYKKYIEKQLKRTNEKIERIENKLRQ